LEIMENVVDAPIEQVMAIRAQLVEAMLDQPEHEEIVRLDANYALQRETFLNLLEGEESGEYDEDSVDVSIVQAVDDSATNQLAIFDMEMEVEIGEGDDDMFDDVAEMSANRRGSQYASFSHTQGEIMATLIEQQYQNSRDGVADIATVAGVTESDVLGAIRGEIAFEPSTNIAIANLFDSLKSNPQAHREFIQLGTQAYNEILQQAQPQTAQMSAPTVDHELRAVFAEQQREKEIGQSLKELEYRANAAFDAGLITPWQRYHLVGGLIEDREDRVAMFSQYCESTAKVEPETYLYAANFALNLLERSGKDERLKEQSDSSPLANATAEELEFEKNYRLRNGFA
jgi:hypothetical protein